MVLFESPESFRRELETVHATVREEFPGVSRIAIALLDPDTDRLHTFLHSTDRATPFSFYEARLADVPSLLDLAETSGERVLDDLEVLRGSPTTHSRRLLESGFRSSYTRAFRDAGQLRGFVFFDSDRPAYFAPDVVRRLSVYARLVALVAIRATDPAHLLRSAVDVAREMSHLRDEETGDHVVRMAHFARVIATEVAGREGRDDEFVEFVHLFSPLHDVGKIGIPDRILLKSGSLTEEEVAVMRSHVERGLALVDALAKAFGLAASPHLDILRNIVACHHEAFDGTGYPRGLAGRAIPLEARIATVADVFDALTSERPYKRPWSNDEAFALLEDLAGRQFDADCVHALVTAREQVEEIQRRIRAGRNELAALHEPEEATSPA